MIEEYDESLKWLKRAVEWGLINYPLLSEIDPIIKTSVVRSGSKS